MGTEQLDALEDAILVQLTRITALEEGDPEVIAVQLAVLLTLAAVRRAPEWAIAAGGQAEGYLLLSESLGFPARDRLDQFVRDMVAEAPLEFEAR